MYTRSPSLYDKLHHFKDYPAQVEKLVAALRKAHQTASTLLEVACGTGKFMEQLRRDYTVEGLDINSDMLAIARERLPGVPLYQGDMRDFDLNRRYDIVACLFGSIACVRTPESFFQAIRTFARHLAPGGILVVEPFYTQESFWVDRVTMNVVDEAGLKIAWMYVSSRVGRDARLNMHYLVGTAAGVDHFTEIHELGLFSAQEYHEAFAQARLHPSYDPVGPAGRGLYIGSSGG